MRRFHLATLLLLSASACSGAAADPVAGGGGTVDASTPDAPKVVTGASGDEEPGTDAGVADAEAGSAKPDTCTFDDPPDDEGFDSNCDGAEGVIERSVYVAQSGDDIFGGSPSYPVKTLARALALVEADPSRRTVYVASSATPYASADLGELLAKGVSVYGSLSQEFGWSRPQGAATEIATTFVSNGRGVTAKVDAALTTLAFAHLTSTRGAGDPIHVVGLLLTGVAPLVLSHVAIDTDNGAGGTDGVAGADAADLGASYDGAANVAYGPGAGGPAPTCPGVADSTTGRGGAGGRGETNSAPQAGEDGGGGAKGGARGVNGNTSERTGKPGERGADGSDGAAASAIGSDDWSVVGTSITYADTTDATIGRMGGGGGGGGGSKRGNNCEGGLTLTSGGAGGGAGACGGLPGTSGTPGGFSVGVLARGPWPSFSDVRITTGNGGRGGDAGAGGAGGAGARGAASVKGPNCGYTGGNGGDGGNGGNGGAGASGAGGWSIGVLSAQPVGNTSGVTITLGSAGLAGASAPNGLAGGDGVALPTYVK